MDLETGAIVGVSVQDADDGDTTTMVETLITAAEQVEAVLPADVRIAEIVGDKGYHSNQTLTEFVDIGLRSYIAEPDRGRRNWQGKADAKAAVYANRRRMRGVRAANGCCGSAVSDWNAPTPSSMRLTGCAACTSAATETS